MGLFEVLRDTASRFLDDKTAENTLYSRTRDPDELLREQFRLPEPETLMARSPCSVQVVPLGINALRQQKPLDEDIYGLVSLTESFFLFESDGDSRMLTFVLPLSTVRRVERLPSNNGVFALKITLYQDAQVVLRFDSSYSRCARFADLLGANLKAQVPLAKGLRQISSSFYSEYLVESAMLRRQGKSKASVQAEVAIPSGGLGRDFGYPGDTQQSHDRSKMRLWLEYFGTHGRNIGILRQPQFFKLVRVGLPNALRGEIWEVCCGSVHLRMKQRALYRSLLDSHEGARSTATDEIDKDLKRSLPEFPAYQSEQGIDRLRRVLVAYSWFAPEIGYCQAMNIVTAALLIFQTEEQAFWTLHILVTRVLPGYYSKTMYGMLLDQKVLEKLLERTMPVLARHLQKLDVPLSVVSLPWFLSLFANSMPLPFAFRVIDILMLEGSRALFQVSLAVLRVNGEQLLEADDNTAVLDILKGYFDQLGSPCFTASGKQITKFQELLVTAFREFSVIGNDAIHELRATHERGVLADIEAYAKRTQLRNLAKPPNLTLEEMSATYDVFYTTLSTASRPGLGNTTSELTFYQFTSFLARIADWARPEVTPREQLELSVFVKHLFKDWDSKKTGLLSLGDCVSGLARLAQHDMMETINYIYSLYGGEILGIADALLLLMRPFSDVASGAVLLDHNFALEASKLGDSEQRAEKIEMLRQQQSALYLSAVSEFIQRAYEVAGLKVQPVMGDAKVDPAPNLIDLSLNEKDETKEKEGKKEACISLPHFRMVLLANETLEQFFSETLPSTIHLTEGTGMLANSGAFRSIMNNVMREGLNIADGLWRGGVTKEKDEIVDDEVKASDRALLDL